MTATTTAMTSARTTAPKRPRVRRRIAARSCKAILDAGASTGSKAWIDPNAGGTDDAFQTWCDDPRGGWT